MKKIILILAVLLTIGAKAQEIKNFEVNNGKLYAFTDKHYELIIDSLSIQYNEFVNAINNDYVAFDDTLKIALYQNYKYAEPLTKDRFIIQTNLKTYFVDVDNMQGVCHAKYEALKNKIIENINKGYYYEN